MSDWTSLHDAPKDRPIWLFLPSSKFAADANGRPVSVEHETLVGEWNAAQSAWMVGERRVYPSLWSDADPAGPVPAQPVLL